MRCVGVMTVVVVAVQHLLRAHSVVCRGDDGGSCGRKAPAETSQCGV